MLAGREQGVSVLETLLALLLLAFILSGGWTLLVRHREAGIQIAGRAEGLETVRTMAWLLSEEVSGGREGLDWGVGARDSLWLRAFRGIGLVREGYEVDGGFRVCFRGVREPSPEKDSILLLGVDGRWQAHDLVGRHRIAEGCVGNPQGWEESWTLSPAPPPAVLGRVFERGSYHLVDGALRYRRGEGGRQPLTPEKIQAGSFMLPEEGANLLVWEITLRPVATRPSVRREAESLLWRGGGR